MIEQIDFYVRIFAIGANLMLLAQVVEGEMRRELKVTLVGLLVGVIAYVINSTPVLEPVGWVDAMLNLTAMSTPFWIWLFARRLFEREPATKIVYLPAAALLVTWLAGTFIDVLGVAAFYANRLISLVLVADLIRVAFAGRADDLIEKRRVIRLVLPLLIGAQVGLILIYELFRGPTSGSAWVQAVNGVLILLITLFSGIALLRTDPELLVETEKGGEREAPAPLDLTPSEQVLHDKLKAAMAEGTYREPGLTIAGLADHLDTPEHRLRALINRRLGYRNFSAFLNRHRIAEAREKLANPDDVDLPVLTIAMDLGYNSLPTFNRAFRSETGTTPSDFRRLSFNDSEEVWADTTGQN
ncbi:AraC family transcriptional regulator [Erythrobacter crassostreae]|nr:helix-turn-helix domain-containing protein [Erythrobacter crassostrea]